MALLYRGESRKKILRHPVFWMKISEIVSEGFSLSRVHRTEVSICSHLSLQMLQKCSLLGKLTSSCNINYLSNINLFVGNLLMPAFCNTCYILRLCNFLNRQRAGICARKSCDSRAGFLYGCNFSLRFIPKCPSCQFDFVSFLQLCRNSNCLAHVSCFLT